MILTEERKNEVLKIVSQNGLSIKNMHPAIKRDKDVVLEAVKNNGMALKYADPTLLEDETIVSTAIISNAYIVEHLKKAKKEDKELIIKALTNKNNFYSGAYRYLPVKLRTDLDILELIAKINPQMLRYATKKVQRQRAICKKFIENEGLVIEFVSDELKNDKELALIACLNYPVAIRHVGDSVKNDIRFALKVIESLNPKELFISTVLSNLSKEIVELYNKDTTLGLLREEVKKLDIMDLKTGLESSLCYNKKEKTNKSKI